MKIMTIIVIGAAFSGALASLLFHFLGFESGGMIGGAIGGGLGALLAVKLNQTNKPDQ